MALARAKSPVQQRASLVLLALGLACAACGPRKATAAAGFDFVRDDVRAQLAAQMPPALLAAVGGALPETWPEAGPPLLLDLQLLQRGRVSLSGGAGSQQGFSALRILGVRARASGDAGGALTPRPAEILVFVGPVGAQSLSDPGVKRFARGAFPLLAEVRPCDDPPASICTDPAPLADAGPLSVENELVLEPQAQDALATALLRDGALELLVLLREPIDSSAQPVAPRGNAHLTVTLDLELVP